MFLSLLVYLNVISSINLVISITKGKWKSGWPHKKVYIVEKNLILRVRSAKENDRKQRKPTSMSVICFQSPYLFSAFKCNQKTENSKQKTVNRLMLICRLAL